MFAHNVYMVVGSPLSYSDMSCAGIHTASKIILLSGAAIESTSAGDAQSLFTLHLLRSKLADFMPDVVVELVCGPG